MTGIMTLNQRAPSGLRENARGLKRNDWLTRSQPTRFDSRVCSSEMRRRYSV
jgi:hypothetical protein